MTLARLALTLALALPVCLAEESPNQERREAAANEPRKEAHDAMPEGTKGVSEGVILTLVAEKGRLVLRTADANLLFMPHWHGGLPKDGGGLDKDVMKRLAGFKAGERVRIAWTWSERRRIETIERMEKPAGQPAAK